jgi:hypothetical protein
VPLGRHKKRLWAESFKWLDNARGRRLQRDIFDDRTPSGGGFERIASTNKIASKKTLLFRVR